MIIVITAVVSPSDRFSDLHKFQNYAESVFYWLRDHGLGHISFDELDRGAEVFPITSVKASKCRRIVHWVEQEAEKQHVKISLDVKRDGEP